MNDLWYSYLLDRIEHVIALISWKGTGQNCLILQTLQ